MTRIPIRNLLGGLLMCAALFAHADEPSTFRDCPACPEMVVIPAGSFDMGAYDGDADERPVHRVTLAKSFAIGKAEVTQAQWRDIMHDQKRSILGNDPSFFSSCGDDCPVEQVSWNDVQIFIQKLNAKTRKQYRLLSEAEWEYACRAGKPQKYCGSDNEDDVAWHGAAADAPSEGEKSTEHVAKKMPNALGL